MCVCRQKANKNWSALSLKSTINPKTNNPTHLLRKLWPVLGNPQQERFLGNLQERFLTSGLSFRRNPKLQEGSWHHRHRDLSGKIICLILWSCTRCTCEHRGVAGRHVVLEHPLLQADLGEMEMNGSFQIMVTWSEMILGNFNLRGRDDRVGMSLIFSPGPRKVQFDQGPCGSYWAKFHLIHYSFSFLFSPTHLLVGKWVVRFPNPLALPRESESENLTSK